MPDTIYYYSDIWPRPDSIAPDGTVIVYVQNVIAQNQKEDNSPPLISVLAIFLFLVWLCYRIFVFLIKYYSNKEISSESRFQQNYSSDTGETYQEDETIRKDYFIYHGSELYIPGYEITAMLEKNIPYYKELEPSLKQRFEKRVTEFMAGKDFIIHSDIVYKEMPVLVSAASVQISFGLDEYLLPWYKCIQIYKEEYFAANSFRVLAGHVQGETVTIAWNHLLKGFDSPDDGANVALHEMAHALYYQHIIADRSSEEDFKHHFNEMMQEGEDVYAERASRQILFSDYAYKDLQEFWAESVEIFFEKPEQLKSCYPELFEIMKDLLKQNPSNKSNPLNVD